MPFISRHLNHYIADVLSAQDYYAFGAPMPGRTTPIQTAADLTSAGTKPYRFGFNGKESDFEVKNIGGSSYDYGARMYDPRLGRWLAPDPLSHVYPFASPYNFALNTPIQAFDPDGEKVLFVNGYYNSGSLSDLAGSEGLQNYWGSNFINGANTYLGDYKNQFIDGVGKWNSTGEERSKAGYEWAKANYSTLTKGVIDEKGVQTETFKVVSHSMGSAYSEGIVKYLEEQGLNVEKVIHLSAADPSGFKASTKPETIQLNYENDIVLGYKNFAECADMIQGIDTYGNVNTDNWFGSDFANSHARTKFSATTFDAIKDLENTKFDFKYSFSPTGRNVDKVGVFGFSGATNGTKFNNIFKEGTNYNFQSSKTATSKSGLKFK